jgi:Rho GDP-dissociation inhibitor/dynein assembly factor 5
MPVLIFCYNPDFSIYVEPNDPRKVIVKKLALCVPERADLELDLTGDISQLKKQVKTIILKGGVPFCTNIQHYMAKLLLTQL